MLQALVVLLWPVGIAVILALTALVAKRSGQSSPPATAPMNGHHGGDLLVGMRAARSSIIGMLLILVVGAVAVYALTSVLGVLIVHAGPSIDKPIYTWMIHHRVHFWKSAMDRLTKIGVPGPSGARRWPRRSAWRLSTADTDGFRRWRSARPFSSIIT